ncbi:MAG: GGDEF domain-containing protein [Desulfobacteraceae bacterium]|nr:MAG: GGDEF domain-containing protein [Desulfobacteraceae bacterium]
MDNAPEPGKAPQGYFGQILTHDQYSSALKARVKECMRRFAAFDELGGPAIPYLSAWRKGGNTIWYEFIGKGLIALLGCGYLEAASVFREAVVERHRFIRKFNRKRLREEILSRHQFKGRGKRMREEVIKAGTFEAVYKMALKDSTVLWIKDQAVLEAFDADDIYLSLGNLTVVTPEMELDEQLKNAKDDLSQGRRKYREQSLQDNLTGLYNTRYLYRALSRWITTSRRKGKSFSLIFMDIDNFKSVVDTHGHLNASKTLQEISRTIRKMIHEPSFGVAYGGDEFVIVLPGFTKEQALAKAESIRARIKQTRYRKKAGLNITISASLGVSTFPDDAASVPGMLARADQAMFDAKGHGKDSVNPA